MFAVFDSNYYVLATVEIFVFFLLFYCRHFKSPVTCQHHTREKAFEIFGTEYIVHAGLFYRERLLTYIVLHMQWLLYKIIIAWI